MGHDIVGIFTLAIVFTILAEVIRNGSKASAVITNSASSFAGLENLAKG